MHAKTAIAPDARGASAAGAPPPVVGKEYPDSAYTRLLARYPALSLAVSMLIPLLITIIALGLTTNVDVRTEGFTAEETNAFMNMKTVEIADGYWQSLLAESGQTLTSRLDKSLLRHNPQYRITLQFVLACRSGERDCDNMLNSSRIAFVKSVEDAATSVATGYSGVCWQNNFRDGLELPASPGCAPVNSVTQYAYPSLLAASPYFRLDGQGDTQMQFTADMHERLLKNPNIDWYTDASYRSTRRTRVLRSQIILGTPVSARFSESQTRDAIDTYVIKMYDAVQQAAAANPQIAVSIGGDRVVEARVLDAMEREAWKAPVGALIIAVILFIHCRTVVITALGLVQILFTYLCTVSIFALDSGGDLPLLSFVSLFFTIVWCVDGVLVVYDNFVYSGVMATSGRRNTLRVSQRMSFVMRKSIKGILTAHLIALIAFSVNTLSPVSELREFAMFMIVMMLVSAYFFIFYAPSAVLFHHFYFSKRRRTLQRQKEIMLRDGIFERNPAMTALIDELEGLKSVTGQTPYATIAEVQAERKKGNKERRTDLVNKTNSLANASFLTEWNVTFRRMNEAADVRRMREHDAAEEERAAAEAAAFGGTPERNQRRRGSNGSEHSDRSPVGDGGEEADAAPVVRIESRHFGADDQQATLDDFADVNEGEADTKEAPLAYRSIRHIQPAAIIHIPPEFLFRNPENVDFARRLVTSRLVAAVPTPADEQKQRQQHQRRLESAAAAADDDDGIEELMLDDDGRIVRAEDARSAAPAAINMPVLRDTDSDDEDEGARQRHARDPLLRLEQRVTPFNAAWEGIAADIQILPGASPMAELTGILAYRTITGLVGPCLNDDNCITRFDSPSQVGARIARVGLIDADGRTQQVAFASAADGGMAEATQEHHEVGCGPCAKTSTVRRRWCCGRWGKRVDETAEERDARIMKKKVKHEGYGRAERFFYNGYATGLHRMRRLVAFLFLVILGLAIWGVTHLEAVDSRVQLLSDSSNEDAFRTHEELFAIPPDSPCDFCGGAYRSAAEYRPQTATSVQVCTNAGFTSLALNGYLDQCGVCFGSDACTDCRGIPNGPHSIDGCGQCLTANDSSRDGCLTCAGDPARRTPDCQYCAMRYGIEGGGPNCSVPCNLVNCPAILGKCNRFTGRCDCHASRELGFFATSPGDAVSCAHCVSGIGPLYDGTNIDVACKRDCIFGQTATAECGTCLLTGRCSACGNGTLGSSCRIQDPAACVHGIYDASNSVCTCYLGYSGPRCIGENVCNGRGKWVSAADSPIETCDCLGSWTGKYCTLCRCKNGGTCQPDGQCVCPAGWSGPTCSSCDDTCSAHGECPTPMRASQYDMEACLGAFCSFEDIAEGRVCSECVRNTRGPCLSYEPPFNTLANRNELCSADPKCYWNATTGSCFQTRDLSDPVNATTQSLCGRCRGFWYGDSCETCQQPLGTTGGCDAAGKVTACDGQQYLPGDLMPVVDQCGVCGGSNHCIGCDGVVAVNGVPKVIDRCGVCGGDGVCSDESSPFEVIIAMGPIPKHVAYDGAVAFGLGRIAPRSYMDPDVQLRMENICVQIRNHETGPNTRSDLLSCPMLALKAFAEDPTTNARLNRTGSSFGFPVREGDEAYRNRILFNFLRETSALPEVGFSSANPYDPGFAPVFMKLRLRALAEHNGDSSTLLYLATRFDLLAESISNAAGVFTMQVSRRWIDALTELQSRSGMAWASGIGFGVFLMLMHILTCSLIATIIAGLAVGFTCIVSLAFFAAFGFQMGAVEQIGVSLLIGLAAEHTIHFVDTYLDTVQGSTSNLFARDISRLAAMRVAIAQSATPIVASAIATVVVACMYLTSDVQPFRRASQITVIVVIMSLVTSLTVVGALLVMGGPTATFRIITIAVVIAMHWVAIWGVVIFALWLSHARAPDGTAAIA